MNSFVRRDLSPGAIIYCILSAVLVTVTIYHYGSGNHAVIIPFLKVTANPDLYPFDYFVAQSEYYHTFLWDVFALILKTGLTVEWLFFITYVVCLIASSLAIYGISMTLFKDPRVGYLAVFIQLVYFIHNAGVGDEFLMDHLLKESQVALPFLLFAVYFFLNRSFNIAYLLLGLGFLIHALSSIYVIMFLSVPLLVDGFSSKNWRTVLYPLAILLLVSIPLLVRKSQHSPESMHMFEVYMDWVEMLRARYAGHSFPFSWSVWKYLKAALVVGLFIHSWKHSPPKALHNVVKYGTYVVFGSWVLGVVFTELIPLPIFIQLQLFRSYALLSLLAVIYWSNYFILSLEGSLPLWKKGIVILATVAMITMLPSEGNPIINEIHNDLGILWKNNYLFIVLFGLMLVILHWVFKIKLAPKFWPVVLLLLMVVMAARKVRKEGVLISSHLPVSWVEVQHWARSNSDISSLFIVPPDMRGFRIDAERTIVGDYKDGIQMYFNPDFGYQWEERMKLFGAELPTSEEKLQQQFKSLGKSDIETIANAFSSHPSVFLVSNKANPHFSYPSAFENEEYIVYKVR